MNHFHIIFFGSFQRYSVQVLEKLAQHHEVSAVVTTPPKPSGRHLIATPTHVHRYAKRHGIPVFALETLASVPKELSKPDFLIVAGYGKLIPIPWLEFPTVMPINLHPSLLPYYRGAFPVEWAILRGETTTGVTLVAMSPEFDTGEILLQKEHPVDANDTRETLYRKLYELGALLLVESLSKIATGEIAPKPQPQGDFFYARRLSRQDGYVPWELVEAAVTEKPLATIPQYSPVEPSRSPLRSLRSRLTERLDGAGNGTIVKVMRELYRASYSKEAMGLMLDRAVRAFTGWPGVWTTVPTSGGMKRLKLIAIKPDVIVQLEGKRPVTFEQFHQAYRTQATTP